MLHRSTDSTNVSKQTNSNLMIQFTYKQDKHEWQNEKQLIELVHYPCFMVSHQFLLLQKHNCWTDTNHMGKKFTFIRKIECKEKKLFPHREILSK